MARRKKNNNNVIRLFILILSSLAITLFSFSLWELIKAWINNPLITLLFTGAILTILIILGIVKKRQLREIL